MSIIYLVIKLKDVFCVIKYNEISKKWNFISETALYKDFLEFNNKRRCINHAVNFSFENKIILYFLDNENKIIEKRDYSKKIKE